LINETSKVVDEENVSTILKNMSLISGEKIGDG